MNRPNPRERWERRYATGPLKTEPAPLMAWALPHLGQRRGTALDIAGGSGRNAVWLAQQGYVTSVVDISPTGLRLAATAALEASVDVTTIERDIETTGLPEGPWDLCLMHRFFYEPTFRLVADVLASGGLFVFGQATVQNLERNERPHREFLIEEGYAAQLCGETGLDIVAVQEAWTAEDAHEVWLVAQKPWKPT